MLNTILLVAVSIALDGPVEESLVQEDWPAPEATRTAEVQAGIGPVAQGSKPAVQDSASARKGTTSLKFIVHDAATGARVPCRIHLADESGTTRAPAGLPFFADHFECAGAAALDLTDGTYTYAIERGPEFTRVHGQIDVSGGKQVVVKRALARLADMAAAGWWSGDLHVHRPPEQMALIMRAEDLHLAPVITWWNEKSVWGSRPVPAEPVVAVGSDRCYHLLAGEDERGGGAFMFFNLRAPIDISGSEREYPSAMRFAEQARQRGAWIELEKPYWWDGPVALACGLVDSIGLANNHMWRGGVLDNEAWGKARDRCRYAPPWGNGLWTQQIYYHVLNCGLRIAPSAGSASGVLPNPVGYNRVYVHLDGPFSYDAWWAGLRAGRCFVTNGPLLRVEADGALPGHVFRSKDGQAISLALTATLAGSDPVSTIEIIKNGRVERRVPSAVLAAEGSLGRIRFERSGWFLVRAIADVETTFRFASTGPFYVEVGPEPRLVRKASAQFFLDWARQRAAAIALDDPRKRREVMAYHARAIRFWQERVRSGVADAAEPAEPPRPPGP